MPTSLSLAFTRHLVGSLLVILFLAAEAASQGVQTGTLTGTVRDTTGLVLDGVSITAVSGALQGPRTATTDGKGIFLLPSLPAGTYTISFVRQGFSKREVTAIVPLGSIAEVHAILDLETLVEQVDVVAVTPTPLATVKLGANYRQSDIDILPNGRTLSRIAELAPAVSNRAPRGTTAQVSVAGAFGYDTVFLVDGVDVNDNLWGSPENLFIEEALQETQVLTGGISAEYGRFSGGVINAVTRSGGNTLSGGFRVNLANPSWIAETPFERTGGISRPNDLSKFFEWTLGGPIVRDRLWFYAGGRNERSSTADAFAETGLSFTRKRTEDRILVKVTGGLRPGHTLQGSYLRNDNDVFGPSTQVSIDPATLVTRSNPAALTVVTYRGVFGSTWAGEVQFSRKTKVTEEDRPLSADLRDSSFFAYDFPLRQYNAPHFNLVDDPEERNNWQTTGNVSHYLSTTTTGSHAVKAGFEHFVSTRIGGNSQSQTGFAYDANFKTDANGQPLFDDDGRLIPLWVSGGALIETITADLGAKLDVKTDSLFLQDQWALNRHWSFDLGLRYERVNSEASGNIVGVTTSIVVPRLGATFDLTGNGQYVLKGTYGHYAGAYNPLLVGQNTTVGNATNLYGVYVGPPGEGIGFAPGLDPGNYVTEGCFTCPPENVSFDDLSSPVVKEFTVSAGTKFGRGYGQLSYMNRRTVNLVDDFVTLETGETTVIRDGVNLGTFANRVYRNVDDVTREYQALILEGQQRISDRWAVDGHWTIQLENHGNVEGESTGNPTEPTPLGDYPEVLTEGRHFPYGRLAGFQRHKVRLWTVYNLELGGLGVVDLAGLWRYDSGTTFSFQGTHRLTSIQRELGEDYANLPTQVVFFGSRGIGSFDGYGLLDLSVNYELPIGSSFRPWLKVTLFNVLNNAKLIGFDTTISPDRTGPTDELGLATEFVKGPRFGEATSNEHFPAPYSGETGGRAFYMAFGVRF